MDKRSSVLAQIENLRRCKAEGKNISDIERENNVYIGFFYDFLRKRVRRYVNDGSIEDSLLLEYENLYQECKYGKRKQDALTCDDTETETENECIYDDEPSYEEDEEETPPSKNPVTYVRSLEKTYNVASGVNYGRIERYEVEYRLDRQTYTVKLSREDMEILHSSYSSDGENLSQKEVCRKFSGLDRRHLKKILYTLGLTKASSPFPPHIFEENSVSDIVEKTNEIKEKAYFKRLDNERINFLERRNNELNSEIQRLKSKHTLVSNFDPSNIKPYVPLVKKASSNCLFLYISDCHVGAYVDNRSIYTNEYNKEEFFRRLDSVVDLVNSFSGVYHFDKIVVCNLGDSLDGYDNRTTRGGHSMPQNMDNKEQFETFTKGMIRMFDSLHALNISNRIDYICVGESNHDGDFGWAANAALEAYLTAKYPTMHVQVFKKYIGVCNYGSHTFVLTHGK